MFVLSLAITFPPGPRFEPSPESVPENIDWSPPRPGDRLTPGRALSQILASRGFGSDQIRAITERLHPYRSPRTLRPGTSLRFSVATDSLPDRIRLELTPDSPLIFARSDSAWTTRVELVPFVMDTVRISGLIESSLWSARLGGDLDRFRPKDYEDLVYDLADVFAWKVDFTRDLKRGDAIRVALERKVRPDGSIRSRHFLAIELKNGDRVLRAIPQPRPNERWAYFDEEGRSMEGAFLRYPVPYRITSQFTARRYHPLLKLWRAHEGIDYGAPAGAPVEVTAAGVVTRAGFSGAIAPDVRPGAHVEQGQIIGRVGSSGLATGPHLHYEFLQHGRHQNPLTVELPGAPPIPAPLLPQFRESRDGALALLRGVDIPNDVMIVAAEGSLGTAGEVNALDASSEAHLDRRFGDMQGKLSKPSPQR